jgi:type II secretory pathway pseudopilin PulG
MNRRRANPGLHQPVTKCSQAVNRDRCSSRGRAFTITEVLVVVAAIGVLLGLLVPALRSVRQSGRQATEMAAARQLITAYLAYSNNNKDALLPGYSTGFSAFDAGGSPIANGIAAARYPWRLAPYFDYKFRGLYTNENQDVLDRMEQDTQYYQYLVSVLPSLGLNTTWLGGDQDDGGFDPAMTQAFGRFYITAITQAHTPDRLMVFASARGTDPTQSFGSGVFEGYFRLRSPYFTQYRWAEDFHASDPPVQYGYLSPRYDKSVVAVMLDGHADLLQAAHLKDMRLWSNQADREDWRLTPMQGP